jgi:NADH-quinone oxidoreductase subunit C/D
MNDRDGIVLELKQRFGEGAFTAQMTRDGIPTLWTSSEQARDVLQYLKADVAKPYRTLYDLTAIDERVRSNRDGQPASDFTVVYHLLSYERNEDVRIKAPLKGEFPSIRTVTDIWPCANWYEREIWDMFGIDVPGHPHLTRILMPPYWKGYPLRKEHPSRATEMGPFELPEMRVAEQERMLQFRPEDWGLERHGEDEDFMFLNLGPQHPGTHGVFRIILQLDGEQIVNAVPDIGYHHRGQEKMAERQSWHTYIPYTDRVEYLSGVLNNLSYCQSVETLAGIEVPERAKVIRIMLAELFRISSHLVWYGTFAQDLGALSPVFYMFTDRERLFDIVQAITGARMHPSWFRIGGVAQDLPTGWEGMVRDFLAYLPPRLAEYDKIVMQNPIFRERTVGVGGYAIDEAIEWGVTGPNLRACGMEWDWRKQRPYGGYDQFEFEIPVGSNGDCYDRAFVRVEEMRQSLRIIEQCMKNMPAGPYKSDHPLTTPPLKEYTMHDIETLITHFLNVSWGPVIPPGEVSSGIESSKGNYNYYLISDGNVMSYRTHIRTPSFPHLQTIPLLARGLMVPDLIAILGSLDFVMSDVDR